MIDTSNKKDFGWGNKIPTQSLSNLSNFTLLDHSALGESYGWPIILFFEEYLATAIEIRSLRSKVFLEGLRGNSFLLKERANSLELH